MLIVWTSESRAHPIGQLVGTKQIVGLYHLALAVNPLGLYSVEPRALLGQKTSDDPHSSFVASALFESPVVRSDPPSDLAAYVPACVVPDQHQHFLAKSFELLGAPLQKARGYPAYRATIHKPKPALSKLGQIEPVARDGLRIGVVLGDRLLYKTQRFALFAEAVQVWLRYPAPPALILETHNPIDPVLCQSHQSIAPSFFLTYSGSGEVIQCLALCQRTPILAKVARIVSPDTRSLVRPSSKLTSAAISIVHKLLSWPNSLGLL